MNLIKHFGNSSTTPIEWKIEWDPQKRWDGKAMGLSASKKSLQKFKHEHNVCEATEKLQGCS